MERQNVRVVVASEYPQVRHFLSGLIERESEAAIVGQAQDAGKALALVRNLRPDVAIIDSNLPHVAGLADIPLSRIGGLDAAQTISKEIPNTSVILLNNLDTGILSDRSLSFDVAVINSTDSTGAKIALALQDLRHELTQQNSIVFASVAVQPEKALKQQVTQRTDKAIFFGALGIAGGWALTLTMFLAPIGIPLAIAGVVTVSFGIGGKLSASLLRRAKNKTKNTSSKI